jgi:hypothetical protein
MKSPATDHPTDLSHVFESSFQATAASQQLLINSSSAAAVSEALALSLLLKASAAESQKRNSREKAQRTQKSDIEDLD